MSVSLEFTGEYGPAQRNFDKLAGLVVDAGDQSASIRFGVGTITWPGGASNNFASPTVVTHGLGRQPVAVLQSNTGNAGLTLSPVHAASVIGSTTFTAFANTVDGQLPAAGSTSTFAWLVIG